MSAWRPGGDIDRQILRLGLPALGALAADPLVSLIDTAFVGRLGSVELGALGVDAALFGFAFFVFNFLAYGTTPMVAGAVGRGDVEKAGRVVVQALTLAVVIGLTGTAVLEAAALPLLQAMGATGELIEPAAAYLRIRALAAPAVLLVTVGHGVFRGYQDTTTPLYVTLGLNAVNLALDPLLIFGLGWGITGAAVATLIAQWIGAGWFLLILVKRSGRLGIVWQLPTVGELRPLLRAGRHLTLRTLALIGALTLATATAARAGTVAVAAHQVVSSLWIFLALTVDALAIAAQALIGRYAGAGEVGPAKLISNRLLGWGLLVGIGLGLVVLLARPVLPALFTGDTGVRTAIESVLPVVALMQPVAALVFVGDGIYIGASRFSYLAGTTVLAATLTAVALLAGAAAGAGLVWIWWSVTLLLMVRGLALAAGYPQLFELASRSR